MPKAVNIAEPGAALHESGDLLWCPGVNELMTLTVAQPNFGIL